jgi:hypothetical protein
MYASSDRSAQVTVFPGADMMKKFEPLVQTATKVPALGADARCTTTTLGGSAGASCLFLHDGDTYILAARVPPAASAPLLGDVTKLAEKMAAAR